MQPVLVKDVNFEINNSMIKSITKVTTEKFTSEIDELKSNHTVELESKMSEKDDTIDGLNATLKDLETFKNSALETQRKKYVDSVENLSKEEKDGLVEKINEYTMETLEKEVALIVGRNALKFTTESDEVILDTVNNDGLEKDFTENDENSQYKGKSYESLIK